MNMENNIYSSPLQGDKKIQKRNNIMWIAIAFILLFAAIFLSVGIIVSVSDKKTKNICTEEVTATVIENKKISSRNSGHRYYTYRPVFRYEYKGREYISETSYSSSPPKFHEGDTAQIFVNPSSPQKIYVPQMNAAKIIIAVFTSIGTLALIAAVIVFVIMHKK